MLRLPFFALHPPKSAGREQFGQHFIQQFFLKRRGARPEDLLRTATELTARTIAYALERFVLGKVAIHRLIISGGGAHNRLLVARLGELLPNLRIYRSDEFGLDRDGKEAIAFAVLADRTMHSLPGNLPTVTGARRSVILGKISRP
jgi:anhydro-N-acetylmuramic acid kinase